MLVISALGKWGQNYLLHVIQVRLGYMRSCLSNSRFAFGYLFHFKDRAHYVAQTSLEPIQGSSSFSFSITFFPELFVIKNICRNYEVEAQLNGWFSDH